MTLTYSPYYILTGVDKETGGARELMFGDFDKSAVEYEMDVEKQNKAFRFIKLTKIDDAEQATIEYAIKCIATKAGH